MKKLNTHSHWELANIKIKGTPGVDGFPRLLSPSLGGWAHPPNLDYKPFTRREKTNGWRCVLSLIWIYFFLASVLEVRIHRVVDLVTTVLCPVVRFKLQCVTQCWSRSLTQRNGAVGYVRFCDSSHHYLRRCMLQSWELSGLPCYALSNSSIHKMVRM